MANNENRKSFTLIELLVVLALVAILSVVVVMTLNPAELIKQARDSNRLSDLSTINTALNLFSADVTSGFMGTSTVVYVSVPDTSPTCANLGLPSIPTSTYTYNCVTAANLRNTDGTGWIPVNFQRISSNSPISQLPIDPQNTTSTKYYTYITGGSWKVIATPESVKYTATAGTDGGSNIGQFEVGNNMSLAPFVDGLVGWWKFDEGSGANAVDSSGYENNGVWNGTSTSRYVAGRVGQYAGYFNGGTDYFSVSAKNYFSPASNSITMSAWINITVPYTVSNAPVFGHGAWDYALFAAYSPGPTAAIYTVGGSDAGSVYGVQVLNLNTWSHVVATIDRENSRASLYINGVLDKTTATTGVLTYLGSALTIGTDPHNIFFNGTIDDARFYRRVLSVTEVLALYNSTK